jgi:glucose-6-phosphate 1-dehydrogenase
MNTIKCAFIILGASGDLTKRKLLPALYNLYKSRDIHPSSIIVGSGRTPLSNDDFRKFIQAEDSFLKMILYHKGIEGLKSFISEKGAFERVIIFMALPPETYIETAEKLSLEGFGDECSLIVEKPFGYDYNSAVELNRHLLKFFKEPQIYRNDHYLAKEAVQNILVFRFANNLFQPLWNSSYIESIQINATETLGVGNRGPYFDKAGTIRDVVQNHLMQLLCLMTMESPVSLTAEDIISKKIDVLRSLHLDQCHRYQYKGYREEKGISPDSTTETFAEIKMSINNFRWGETPVYIRCGKAANRTGTEISVRFKPLPKVLFNTSNNLPHNSILFKIQPAEGIIVNMSSKEPGNEIRLSTTNMAFCYRDSFTQEIPEAYQRLLLDVLRKDHTLFVNSEESELLWKIFQDALDSGPVTTYEKGTIPESAFAIRWNDFDYYSNLCA